MSTSTNFSQVSETLKSRLTSLGKSSLEVGKKVGERATFGFGRVKEYFSVPTAADKLVEESTPEGVSEFDWGKSLQLCDQINNEQIPSVDAARAIKKRLLVRNFEVQLLTLTLLETMVKNCEKMFSEVASEKVLDEMVRIADDHEAPNEVREKSLKMIESWGEETDQLHFLPVFAETYKSLKSRGVRFPGRDNESLAPIFTPRQSAPIATPVIRPGAAAVQVVQIPLADSKEVLQTARNSAELLSTVLTSAPPKEALQDELTSTLVSQCQRSQAAVQHVVQTAGDNESLLFEALAAHDELEKVLKQHVDLQKETSVVPSTGDTASVPLSSSPPASRGSQEDHRDLAELRIEDDEATGATAEEEALKRNRPTKAPAGGHQGEDAAMADLDSMIFGAKGSSGSAQPHKDDKDDMIVF